ncbi:chalcone isomerase family protein [Aquimarina sp. ERC-38]|uniref:chalcone isomerase family protein n=1 Tax=Aquimarina sp. ERC-38 TaxID=2949996 RepID=UPI00224803D2|nr:chalcone isomerase family protein [Aquimarina sp. ERC-38]UZO80069.1 chalcone isomerase family protein [Aquimarina sp. ERC-38]
MKKFSCFLTVLLFTLSGFSQVRVGKAIFPYETQYQDSIELKLNGGGIREILWVDLYSGGLYLPKPMKDPLKILDLNETMAIHLNIVSKFVTQERMIKAVREGFEKATFGNTKALDKRITRFINFFSEPIVKRDVFELVYIKNKGVHAYKNKKFLGLIEGRDFKYALFKIWLGDEPASEALKLGMLGLE